MSLKIYTITVDGDDNGNVIAQPFTIEVIQLMHVSEMVGEEIIEMTKVQVCTKNGTMMCGNTDIPDSNTYDLQQMSSSSNAVLANTIEVALEAAYPGNWS